MVKYPHNESMLKEPAQELEKASTLCVEVLWLCWFMPVVGIKNKTIENKTRIDHHCSTAGPKADIFIFSSGFARIEILHNNAVLLLMGERNHVDTFALNNIFPGVAERYRQNKMVMIINGKYPHNESMLKEPAQELEKASTLCVEVLWLCWFMPGSGIKNKTIENKTVSIIIAALRAQKPTYSYSVVVSLVLKFFIIMQYFY